MDKIRINLRFIIQSIFTLLTNANLKGFFKGEIHRGGSKALCVPGLNCYSCPGALGACPIGSFQAVLNSRKYSMSYYIAGFLVFIGGIFGRFVCGYLCPFGLVQDLLYRLGPKKKLEKLPMEKYLRKLKYLILLVFVIGLPVAIKNTAGMGSPWFCKYICPSGTLMGGLPLILVKPGLRAAIGRLFFLKLSILIAIVVLSIFIYRPFCRYICPLGAIYGFFNPISLLKFQLDREACIECNACTRACKLNIVPYKTPNSRECIRCGDCIEACPKSAIDYKFRQDLASKDKK